MMRDPWSPAENGAHIHRPATVRRSDPALHRHVRSPSPSSSWSPGIGGATADDLASRYVGKSAGAEQIHQTAVRLGFTDPIWVQYGRFVEGLFVGADYNTGPATEHCPAPVPRLLLHHPEPRAARPARPAAGHAVARGGRRGAVAGRRGRARACSPRCRRGSVFDRGGDGRRPRRRLAADLLHRPAVACRSSATGSSWTAPGGSYTPFERRTRSTWAYDLLLPWITLAFLYAAGYARLTRAGMLETMSEDYIRTARAKGLPERDGRRQARAARGAHPDPHDLRPRPRACCSAARSSPRPRSRCPGIGKYAVDAIDNNDLPKVLGVTLLGALFIVLANLIVDLLYAVVDPRVRLMSQ